MEADEIDEKDEHPKKTNLPTEALKPVPLMMEFSLTVSRLIVILVSVFTLLASLVSGAGLWMTALRTSAAILSLGLFFWVMNGVVNQTALAAARTAADATSSSLPSTESTVEKAA